MWSFMLPRMIGRVSLILVHAVTSRPESRHWNRWLKYLFDKKETFLVIAYLFDDIKKRNNGLKAAFHFGCFVRRSKRSIVWIPRLEQTSTTLKRFNFVRRIRRTNYRRWIAEKSIKSKKGALRIKEQIISKIF